MKSNDKIKIFTVRTSAFDAAAEGDGAASVENGSESEGEGTFISHWSHHRHK